MLCLNGLFLFFELLVVFLLITGMLHMWMQVDLFLLQLDAIQMLQMLLSGTC
jgi:hypothetical protein